VPESNEASASAAAAFGGGEATLFEVTDGGAVGRDTAGVLSIGRARTSARAATAEKKLSDTENPCLRMEAGGGKPRRPWESWRQTLAKLSWRMLLR
jgi:hypothetical protein